MVESIAPMARPESLPRRHSPEEKSSFWHDGALPQSSRTGRCSLPESPSLSRLSLGLRAARRPTMHAVSGPGLDRLIVDGAVLCSRADGTSPPCSKVSEVRLSR